MGKKPDHARRGGCLMEIFMMGKYSAHIWSSFGVTALVLIICVVQARMRHQNVLSNLKTRIKAMESEQ
jgi:heme exporter protein CcmD